jgi:hypothetical protein
MRLTTAAIPQTMRIENPHENVRRMVEASDRWRSRNDRAEPRPAPVGARRRQLSGFRQWPAESSSPQTSEAITAVVISIQTEFWK